MKTPCIKICGLTRTEEADFLNKARVNYAGFVFFEKSKRNVSFLQAKEIMNRLSPDIERVAVTVSPSEELLEEIENAGFDILQVHGELKPEILEKSTLPIWRACNLKEPEDIKKLEQHKKITGYVIDAGNYGSGKTFDWNSSKAVLEEAKQKVFAGKQFILAGGLNSKNVVEGINTFSPDIVDVSSGVEGKCGKDKILIEEFIGKVREHGKNE